MYLPDCYRSLFEKSKIKKCGRLCSMQEAVFEMTDYFVYKVLTGVKSICSQDDFLVAFGKQSVKSYKSAHIKCRTV